MSFHAGVFFKVEKIIDVVTVEGSIKNFKVQWAPTWVSSLNLVGCEKLIKDYLGQTSANHQYPDGSILLHTDFNIESNEIQHRSEQKELSNIPEEHSSVEERASMVVCKNYDGPGRNLLAPSYIQDYSSDIFVVESDVSTSKNNLYGENPNFEWMKSDITSQAISYDTPVILTTPSSSQHKSSKFEKVNADEITSSNELHINGEEILVIQPKEFTMPIKSKSNSKLVLNDVPSQICDACGKVFKSMLSLQNHKNRKHFVKRRTNKIKKTKVGGKHFSNRRIVNHRNVAHNIDKKRSNYLGNLKENTMKRNVIIKEPSLNHSESYVMEGSPKTLGNDECSIIKGGTEMTEKGENNSGPARKKIRVENSSAKESSFRMKINTESTISNFSTDINNRDEELNHPELSENKYTVINAQNDRKYKCIACGTVFVNKRLFSKHQCYSCSFCQKIFDQQFLLDQHMKLHESLQNREESPSPVTNVKDCVGCGTKFTMPSSFKDHRCYACSVCHKVFTEFHVLDKHYSQHKSDKTIDDAGEHKKYICIGCGVSFTYEKSFINHKCYSCTLCFKVYSHMSELDKHFSCCRNLNHLGNCDEIVGKNVGLVRQPQGSEDSTDSPLSCNICGVSFTYRKRLVNHKCVTCPSCKKTFKRKSLLYQHKCSGKSIHQCKKCHMQFTYVKNFKKHRCAICTFCKKTFYSTETLRYHLSNVGRCKGRK